MYLRSLFFQNNTLSILDSNPTVKAKAVIEEIEEMKKIENVYLEALEKGLVSDRRYRSRSRSHSKGLHLRKH